MDRCCKNFTIAKGHGIIRIDESTRPSTGQIIDTEYVIKGSHWEMPIEFCPFCGCHISFNDRDQ